MNTIPLYDVIEDLAETTAATVGLRSTGTATEKSAAVPTADMVKTSPFRQIDGDFTFWNRGVTSVTASGYLSDMWKATISGTATISRITSPTTSKSYGINFSIDAGDTASLTEYIKGRIFSNKKLSLFIYCKYTTLAPTVTIGITADITMTLSNTVTPTTSWAWHRVDITNDVDSTSTYNGIRILAENEEASTVDLQIDKIRIVESDLIPSGVTPEWVKSDEDYYQMQAKVSKYFQRLGAQKTFEKYGIGTAFKTTECFIFIRYNIELIRALTTTPNYGGNFRLLNGATSVVVTSIAINTALSTSQTISLQCNVASGLTVGTTYELTANNDATSYIYIDAAY